MKVLGIDSSGLVAGIAVLDGEEMLAEYNVNYKKTHSQTLLPMLDEVRKMIDLNMEEIDAIAVAAGPGSFTGLRIGSATAKGLGLALDKPLVEVPTLEGLAYNYCGTSKWVCPLIDARRNQVYTGIYEFVGDELKIVKDQEAIEIDKIIDVINLLNEQNPGREVVFLGDGVPVYKEKIIAQVKIPFSFATPGNNKQRAASIAALGAVYLAQGKTVSARDHQPEYLRQSQAERERQEKENA